MNGPMVKDHISLETRFEYNVIRRTSFVALGLSSSSFFPLSSSQSMTPSRQEIDHPTSSSNCSTSPTTTVSSDNGTRRREDLSWIGSHPAPVSNSHVERNERCDPLYSDTPELLQEFRDISWMTQSHISEPIHPWWWRRVRVKHQFKIRDTNLDRQPKIQSSSAEETLQRILGQTNNDCRFRIFISTKSFTNNVCLSKEDSRPRYVLVHTFLRKLRIGSKKWRWLNQRMNWDLRHLFLVFQCRISKYLMRDLLQQWTESSIIPNSEERSVWRNKKHKKMTVPFAEDRLLTWSMGTSGSQEPKILLRIMPTYSLFVFEMMKNMNIRFELGRNSLIADTNPIWRHLGRIVHENLRNSRPYWNCLSWRFIGRS